MEKASTNTVIIPRNIYLKIINHQFSDVNIEDPNGIPAQIYDACDKLLGVHFQTVVHKGERLFKCEIIDTKKWCLARVKYGI